MWDHSCFASEKNTFSVRQESEDLLLDDADNHTVFEVVANLEGLDKRKRIHVETRDLQEFRISPFLIQGCFT